MANEKDDMSGKGPRTIYLSDRAWEGFQTYSDKIFRSVSYIIDQYGLELRDKEVVPIERAAKALKMEGFSTFWSLYPKKVAKGEAEKAWMKIAAKDREMVLERLRNFRFPREVKFIPFPATWLNGKRYLDDPLDDLPLASQPSRKDWDAAPAHLKAIHKKIMDQQPLTETETEIVADFMESL